MAGSFLHPPPVYPHFTGIPKTQTPSDPLPGFKGNGPTSKTGKQTKGEGIGKGRVGPHKGWLTPLPHVLNPEKYSGVWHVWYGLKLHWFDLLWICASCTTHTHNCFTALWNLSGTIRRVSRYQKKHSPTDTHHGHQSSLSAFSIYYDPWHPPYSIHMLYSLFPQSLSKFSFFFNKSTTNTTNGV